MSSYTSATCCGTESTVVWNTWTEDYYQGSSTTVGSSSSCSSTVTSAGYSSVYRKEGVWCSWVIYQGTSSEASIPSAWVSVDSGGTVSDYPSFKENEEERAARELRDKETMARIKKDQEDRIRAENKAKELLEFLIGSEQMKVYEETGRVFLRGKRFDYQIVRGFGFNLRKIDKGKVRDLCVHLKDRSSVPETDNVISLLLSLKEDEDRILGMANDHGESRDTVENLPLAACVNW